MAANYVTGNKMRIYQTAMILKCKSPYRIVKYNKKFIKLNTINVANLMNSTNLKNLLVPPSGFEPETNDP